MQCVLDCSIAMTWCFDDESTPATDAFLERLGKGEGVVPSLWHVEIGHVLITAERKGRTTPDRIKEFLADVSELEIVVDPRTSAAVFCETVAIARRHRLTVYNSTYLELAIRRSLPLATLDRDLAEAARREGVRVLPE